MRKGMLAFLSFVLLCTTFLSTKHVLAYTDYSQYRIITGGFVGEGNVKIALNRLIADTGWWATYEPTGEYSPYYVVSSRDYPNEQVAKAVLNQFSSSTGINANFQPIGDLQPYRKIITGSFYGEELVKSITNDFVKSTGINASYEKTGEFKSKSKLITSGIVGEENTRQISQNLQSTTGIVSSYEPTGEYQQHYKLLSGTFNNESVVQSILSDFVKNTGLNSSYVPVQFAEEYVIKTGWFVGESNVQKLVAQIKADLGIAATYVTTGVSGSYRIVFDPLVGDSLLKVTNYLNQKGWWFEKNPTGNKKPITFQIVSEETTDSKKLNNAMIYFRSRNWWAEISQTGKNAEPLFKIVTNPITDEVYVKALNFFNQMGIGTTKQPTDEKDYSYYRLITEPTLDSDKVGNYFKSRGWWYTTHDTDKLGYAAYQISTVPLLGTDLRDRALNFFNKNNLWAQSDLSGNSEPIYRIVTGTFRGYDNVQENAKMLTNRYGWWVTTEKVQNGPQITNTNYNISLNDMLNIQLTRSPMTDKYRNEPAYVYSAYISNNKINSDKVNVRKGPSTNFEAVNQLNTGFEDFTILGYEGEWTKISLMWKYAKPDDVSYYLNPNNFTSDSKQSFQFLKLSQPAGVNVDEVNEKILNTSKGILSGKAAAFVQAANQYKVNELYLIAHSLLETGNGTSELANGVYYNGVKVYNMYGYSAYDGCPKSCGSKRAYEEGWFTPEAAIIGGARLISQEYIYNTTFQQDTLYKMRWNPVIPYHQYATDVGWASKQVNNIYNYYQLLDNYTIYIDIPVYK